MKGEWSCVGPRVAQSAKAAVWSQDYGHLCDTTIMLYDRLIV